MRPDCIGNYLDLIDEDNASYPGSDELLSIGSSVGKKLGLVKIGIHIETLLPGRRTSWPHAESEEEEFGFVIEGNPDVWLDGVLHALKPGDFVALPSGTGMAHVFINNSHLPVKLLVGGEARKPTNKIFYPLHQKRNQDMKQQGKLWENPPVRTMGSHDGLPETLKKADKARPWNLPFIETENLIIRPLEISDASAIFKFASQDEVTKFVTWPTHLKIEESVSIIKFFHTNYLQQIPDAFGICLKSDPTVVIGTLGAFWSSKSHKVMELGFVLSPLHWGKGVMKEAVRNFIPYIWDNYEVQRIQARCVKENTQSRRLMEKMGMKYDGLMMASGFCKGKSLDLEMFCFIRKPG